MWDHRPSPDEVLDERVRAGWRPTASCLLSGDVIDGFADTRFWNDR